MLFLAAAFIVLAYVFTNLYRVVVEPENSEIYLAVTTYLVSESPSVILPNEKQSLDKNVGPDGKMLLVFILILLATIIFGSLEKTLVGRALELLKFSGS